MTRRLLVSAVLSAPLLLVGMIEMVSPDAVHALGGWLAWIELLLGSAVVIGCGAPFFVRGWSSVRTGHLNMFTLIALGTGAAYLHSAMATIAPGVLSGFSFHGHGGSVPLYFESAAVIVTLVLVGQVLELRALRPHERGDPRSSSTFRTQNRRASCEAKTVAKRTRGERAPRRDFVVGDRLRVRPGEDDPDRRFRPRRERARSTRSMITGVAVPVEKRKGDRVTGGTVSTSGALVIVAERVGEGNAARTDRAHGP